MKVILKIIFRSMLMNLKMSMENGQFFKIYFNRRLITSWFCGGFCHTLTRVSHRCTCVPHPKAPSHLPPHPIPLGCPSAPALSALFHALNLHWSSVSHMVIYLLQCYSHKSSPSPSPTESKSLFFISVSLSLSRL